MLTSYDPVWWGQFNKQSICVLIGSKHAGISHILFSQNLADVEQLDLRISDLERCLPGGFAVVGIGAPTGKLSYHKIPARIETILEWDIKALSPRVRVRSSGGFKIASHPVTGEGIQFKNVVLKIPIHIRIAEKNDIDSACRVWFNESVILRNNDTDAGTGVVVKDAFVRSGDFSKTVGETQIIQGTALLLAVVPRLDQECLQEAFFQSLQRTVQYVRDASRTLSLPLCEGLLSGQRILLPHIAGMQLSDHIITSWKHELNVVQLKKSGKNFLLIAPVVAVTAVLIYQYIV